MADNLSNDWPPPYSMRQSKRARNVSLRITEENGLEIVIPAWIKYVDVDNLLQKNRQWIEKNRSAIQKHNISKIPPAQLSLKAIQEHWEISYLPATSSRNRTKTINGDIPELIIYGDPNNHQLCLSLLHRWLKRKAEEHLLPWLHKLSIETNLPFNTSNIKRQKTLWGSCTTDKNISLNSKLLLLNPEYVEMIMIHELCHTVHLNHSKIFWQKVECFVPDYKEYNSYLRKIQLPI